MIYFILILSFTLKYLIKSPSDKLNQKYLNREDVGTHDIEI